MGVMSRMMTQLEQWWKAERSRRFLWLPVGFAAGIGLYFGLPVEPPVWLLPNLFFIALVATIMLWRRPDTRAPLLVLLLILLFSVSPRSDQSIEWSDLNWLVAFALIADCNASSILLVS